MAKGATSTLQAAILMCKVDIFADEIDKLQKVSARYAEAWGIA
jgi:hypothetical protein